MTNQASSTKELANHNENSNRSIMKTLNKIVGLHHYITRSVFECEGQEIVFVNENLLGFVSAYINGERVLRKWKVASTFTTDITVKYDGVEYRFISSVTDWVASVQKTTIIVNDSKAQSKTASVLTGLSGLKMAHALIVPLLTGILVGFLVGRIIF